MARKPQQRTDTALVAGALAHPLRLEILRRSIKPVSPKQLADALGEPLGNVSYHSRVLIDAGLLETVRTVQVRGALQRFNRRSATAKKAVQKIADDLGALAEAL